MDICELNKNGEYWNETINFADNCSWKAGPYLANQMRKEEFVDWERVFIARNSGEIIGFCTLAKTDCIPDVPYTPYIGFMFVKEEYRGNRISEKLIKYALEYAKKIGYSKVYLVSGEQGLYEKYGFIKIDDKEDRWGNKEQIFSIDI